MDILEPLKAIIGLLVLVIPSGLLVRNAAIERRAKKVAAESPGFDLYVRATDELLERDVTVTNLRQQREQDAKERDEMREQIKLLVRDSNAQARRSRQLTKAVTAATADAADYKARWENTVADCQRMAAKIRILEAILTKNGWYTPEIQAAVQAELDLPAPAPTVKPAEPPSEKETP